MRRSDAESDEVLRELIAEAHQRAEETGVTAQGLREESTAIVAGVRKSRSEARRSRRERRSSKHGEVWSNAHRQR